MSRDDIITHKTLSCERVQYFMHVYLFTDFFSFINLCDATNLKRMNSSVIKKKNQLISDLLDKFESIAVIHNTCNLTALRRIRNLSQMPYY